MLRLTANITIGSYRFFRIVDCEIESSWETLTDTAIITIPRQVVWEGKLIYELINKGDKVVVELGYDDRNEIVFEGFVVKVSAKIPVVIECQDHAWLLKQGTITKSYKSVTLRNLLNDILPLSVSYEAPGLGLGPFRISKATPAKILEEIEKSYFQKTFFRNGKLYVGFAYVAKLQNNHSIHFQKHVVENDLDFLNEEDVKIKLKVINIDTRNKKTEYEFGDPEGEQRTLHTYNKSAADIRTYGKQEIERLRYTGYKGTITIFGEPMVNHGDIVELHDDFYPERDGSYLVKSVFRSFGSTGYRQELELDTKVA